MGKILACVLFLILFSAVAFSLPPAFDKIKEYAPEAAEFLQEFEAAKLRGDYTPAISADRNNQVIDCNGTTVDGIGISNKDRVTVRNCVIKDASTAISISDSTNIIIEKNRITGGNIGIHVYGTTTATIRDNVIEQTKRWGICVVTWDNGGAVKDAVDIFRNNITLSGDDGIFLINGMVMEDYTDASAIGNRVSWSADHGIIFMGVSNGIISDNMLTLNDYMHIYATGAPSVTISGNVDPRCSGLFMSKPVPVLWSPQQQLPSPAISIELFNPTRKDKYYICFPGDTDPPERWYDPSAVPAIDPVQPPIKSNKVMKPLTKYGIMAWATPGLGPTIRDNTFLMTEVGITMGGNGTVANNRLAKGHIGIRLQNSGSKTRVSGNLAIENIYGFVNNASDGVRYTNNKASFNNISGFYAIDSKDLLLKGNAFSLNLGCGAYLYNSPKSNISSNRFYKNSRCGIHLYRSPGVVSKNNATYNGNAGIFLNQSNSGTIEHNDFSFNWGYGARLVSSAQNKIKFNDFRNNTMAGANVNGAKINSDSDDSSNTWKNNTWDMAGGLLINILWGPPGEEQEREAAGQESEADGRITYPYPEPRIAPVEPAPQLLSPYPQF
jgi:parallel beta-helix repeat protein